MFSDKQLRLIEAAFLRVEMLADFKARLLWRARPHATYSCPHVFHYFWAGFGVHQDDAAEWIRDMDLMVYKLAKGILAVPYAIISDVIETGPEREKWLKCMKRHGINGRESMVGERGVRRPTIARNSIFRPAYSDSGFCLVMQSLGGTA